MRDAAAALDATHGADVWGAVRGAARPILPRCGRAGSGHPADRILDQRLNSATRCTRTTSPPSLDAVALLEELGHEVVEVDLPVDKEPAAAAT